MELAKTVLYLALLSATFFVLAWWSSSRANVMVGTEQAFLNDLCSLLESPANTTLTRRYYIDYPIAVEDGTLTTTIALAPQCASMSYNGTRYVYSLPVRSSEILVLRGNVRLNLSRVGDGVWVSKA